MQSILKVSGLKLGKDVFGNGNPILKNDEEVQSHLCFINTLVINYKKRENYSKI